MTQVTFIKDVYLEPADPTDPFSIIKSGKLTITAPFRRFNGLYNKQWQSHDVPMSAFERLVSSAVENECPNGTVPRFHSDAYPYRYFAAVQLTYHSSLTDSFLDLLSLEGPGPAAPLTEDADPYNPPLHACRRLLAPSYTLHAIKDFCRPQPEISQK